MNLTEQHAADLLEFRAIKPRLRQLLTDTLTVMRDQNVLDDLADHCAPNGDPCSKGHPLSGGNLYLYAKGRRECKTCSNDRAKAYMKISTGKRKLLKTG